MIAVDTNIMVRLLTRDDEAQFLCAQSLFSRSDVFLPDSVILETEWVLRYAYSFSREKIVAAFRRLLGLPNVQVADTRKMALAVEWHEKGLDLRLGSIEHGTVLLDESGVAAARDLSVQKEPFCAQCFCKWHCAGGCHVNHVQSGRPGEYDRLCIQTRIITLRNILKAMDREDLVRELLKNRRALERAAWQTPDTLVDQGSWT